MPKSLTITVPLDGISQGKRKTEIEAFGYTGQSCKSVTEAFTKAFGSMEEEVEKPEMYHTNVGVERLSEGG